MGLTLGDAYYKRSGAGSHGNALLKELGRSSTFQIPLLTHCTYDFQLIATDDPTAQRHADSCRVMRQRDLSRAFPRGRPYLLENRVPTTTAAGGKAKHKV